MDPSLAIENRSSRIIYKKQLNPLLILGRLTHLKFKDTL